MMKLANFIKFFSLLMVLLAVVVTATAQWTGPTTAPAGQQIGYSFSNGNVYTVPDWVISNGSIISSSSSGTTYSVTVQWASVGAASLSFKNRSTIISTLSVTVCSPPSAPSTSFTYSNQCHPAAVIITRTGNPPGGETWYWQSSADGPSGTNTSLGSGASINVNSTLVGNYYLRAWSSCGWSVSSTSTGTIPARLESVTGASVCAGNSASLSAWATGATQYSWYDACTAGTLLYRGPGNFSTPLLNSTTYYWVAVYNGGSGIDGPRMQVAATVLATPGTITPAASQSLICGGGGSVTLSATGGGANDTYRWYTTPSGGSPLSSTTQDVYATTTFYVSGFNTITGCEGPRSAITITVHPYIPAPTGSAWAICGSGTVRFTASPGLNADQVQWFSTPSGGSPVATGSPFDVWLSSSATYYAGSISSTTGCISSNRIPITGTVNPIPSKPTVTVVGSATTCEGGSAIRLQSSAASGNQWYRNGTLLSGETGTQLILSSTLGNTGNYSVIQTITGCGSPASDAVVVTVNPTPAANLAVTPVSFSSCGSSSITLTIASSQVGVNYQLYKDGATISNSVAGTGGNLVMTSSGTVSSSGTISVRATHSASGCFVTLTNTTAVTIQAIPQIPTGQSVARCGSGIITLSATPVGGDQVRWYSSATGGTLLTTGLSYGPSLSTTTTFYVATRNSSTGCESTARLALTATINTIPANPGYSGHIRFGSGPLTLAGSGTPSGGNYNWYNGLQQYQTTNLSYPVTSVSASTNNYMYLSAVSSAGCESGLVPIHVVVYPLPVVTAPQNYIVKETPVTLDAGAGYDTYIWKNSVNATVGTNRTFTTAQASTYTVTVTKTGVSGTSNPFVLSGSQFTGMNKNYVVSNTLQIPGITDATSVEAMSAEKVAQQVAYFDGLGRPSQTISTQASVSKSDLVAPVVYDAFGREARKYLPAVTGNSGRFKEGLIDAVGNYTVNTYTNTADKIADDTRPFAETRFEASPLNRPDKEYGAGLAWSDAVGGNNKYIQHQYLVNVHNTGSSATQEKIIAWTINSSGIPVRAALASGFIVTGGYYASGQLQIKSTKDEEGNEVREYTDKLGRVILKKVQATAAGANNLNDLTGVNPGWALTYYLYDDLGNLRYVFPPELSKAIHAAADTYAVTTTDLDTWAFQYKYDDRKRMSEKRVPGAGWVYMVYDKRDRLVLTQDANQRAGAIKYWTFTKYDELNRPILTGIKDTAVALSQAQMQSAVNAHFAKTSARWGETYVGNAVGNVHGYTNRAYPVRTGNTTTEVDANKYLTVTYYDNYDFRSTWYGTYTYLNESLNELANGVTYQQPGTENLRVVGQVTGTKTKVLDGGVTGGYTWLKAVTYYDDKYRVIQTLSDNYKGGMDRVTHVIDFVGRILEVKLTHSEYDVVWRDLINTEFTGNRLRCTSTSGWNTGGLSRQQLAANQSGWLEAVVSETNTYRWFGLTDVANASHVYASPSTVDYLVDFATTLLRIYENGVLKYSGAPGDLKTGEILRIERVGTTIYYKRNGTTIYTSTTPSSSVLIADAAFSNVGATLVDTRASFAGNFYTITRRFEYDHAGRLLKTWHKLDTQPEILLALNEYNELGQLVDKKLHSTVSTGSNAKQSVDYRYNIRGWLTSMNDASLANTTATTKTNDDTGDLFGMNLHYNTTDLGTTGLYNGNISAMAWSNNLGLGSVKQNGYAYTYDPLNRIKSSQFKEKNSVWTTPSNSALSETGFLYDLNGNITQLQRNDKRTTGWMDNLGYTYTGNQLLRVTDSGDDFAGFIDGQPGTGNDYSYDANGNMTRDLNKGIGATLADATNLITYNYLNLPETITKGNNSIRYIYDAGGRKLAQVTTFGGQQKQTDYAGEFQYENDQLQFISHEEGRIVIAANKTLFTHAGDALTNITAATSTLATVTLNGQTYVRAMAVGTTAKQGMFPIGGTFTVQAGDQYRIRAKGYRTGTNAVYLYIRTNSTDLNWPGGSLANGSVAEAFTEQIITIPTGHTTLQVGVVWNTVTANEQFFLNDFEITRLTTNTTPEYQYYLKDHLGNVRLTFTSKDETETNTATLEPANALTERSQFLRYDNAKLINSSLFDRTNGVAPTTTTGYAQRLNGSANEKYGLAKSLSVMPGDVINAEVYAKYVDPNSANWTGALSTLMSQIAANTAGVVVDGATYTSSTASFPAGFAGLQGTTDNGAPRAYLNWLVFDRNYVFITGGFKQITTAAKETGTDVPHERIFNTSPITITQPGYVYIYLSNESTTPVEVFFDEFKVTHTKSPVIQMDDYYPFGLAFNSNRKENSIYNSTLFQSQEIQDELSINLFQFEFRMQDPTTGRFISIDPLSEVYAYNSPYAFAENRVIDGIDLEGLEWRSATTDEAVNYISNGNNVRQGQAGYVTSIDGGAGGYYTWVGEHQYTSTCNAENGCIESTRTTFTASAFSTANNSVVVLGQDGTVNTLLSNENGMVELPEQGTGFVTHKRNDVMRNGQVQQDQWGSPDAIAKLMNAAINFYDNTGGDAVSIGDLSLPNGENPYLYNTGYKRHSTHKSGTQVDWRYPGANGQNQNYVSTEGQSISRVQIWMTALRANGYNNFILSPDLRNRIFTEKGTWIKGNTTINNVRYRFNSEHSDHGHSGIGNSN